MTSAPDPWWDDRRGGWVIRSYELARQVLQDATTFTVDDPRFSTGLVVGRSMLSTDGPGHAHQRRAFQPLFTKRAAVSAEAAVAAIVRRRLSSMASDGEWRTGFAAPVAVDVMIELFGLDVSPSELLGWYRTIVAAVNADGDDSAVVAYAALAEVIGASEVIAGLVENDGAMSAAEAASNTAVGLFGGIETVEGTIASALYHAFGSVDRRDALRADDALVGPFVEEVLRLEPAAAVVHRYATTDADLAGWVITAGDFVEVSILDANRDGSVFDSPHEFRLDRANGRAHLSFAVGPHVCLGLHLARLEAATAIRLVLDDQPTLVRDDSRSSAPAGAIFRKPATLYLRSEQP
ncbi:MAG: cytochrome P450 [Acidimicrobiales bacterium]